MPFKIDFHKCDGCGACYRTCPADVIGWDKETAMPFMAYPQECWHCGVCWMECNDTGAMAITPTLPPQCLSERNPRFLSLPTGAELSRDNIGMI
ncbi:MAG: ferredoxin family protein [Burkholderiaceae bacterium]|nr:ferredoxin family protein [Burkholderiaceae bacterium]